MSNPLGNKFLLLAACATAALTTNARAQEAAPADTSEEIVVTATQRSTALQDVPLAVTAITAQAIQNAGVRDIQDLTNLAPSMQFNVSENETSATARIRGVGTQGSNPGLESAVGIFIDGVYRARNGVGLTDLGEVQQIEVLRGPQGTLFGRNTSAGLITVRTVGPDLDEFGAGIDATYGDYEETRVSGYVTGPLVQDKVAGRLFAARSTRDGFYPVENDAGIVVDELNNRDLWTVRGQLLFAPTKDVDLRLIADYTDRDENCCVGVYYDPRRVNGTPATYPTALMPLLASLGAYGNDGVAGVTRDLSERRGYLNRDTSQQVEDWGVSGELNWELGIGKLTAITAYRDWDYVEAQDRDNSAADMWYRRNTDPNGFAFKIFTQEVRLAGRWENIDWLFGVFYSDEELTRGDSLTIGSDFGPYLAAAQANPLLAQITSGGYSDVFKQDSNSIALFTHNIVELSERWDLTVGLRYTQEEKDMTGTARTTPVTLTVPGPATVPVCTAAPTLCAGLDVLNPRNDALGYLGSRDENEWSGILALGYEVSDNINTYASYSRGYKAGGFNLERQFSATPGTRPNQEFESEMVDAYELGVKTSWLDRDLTLNLALFWNEYENFQLNQFTGVRFIVTSVPEATAKGVELEASWRTPVEGLSLTGGVAYNDTSYGDRGAWANGPNPLVVDGLERLPNSRLTNSPLWTVTSAATYERPLFDGAALGLAYLDARYVSDQNTGSDLNPTKIQEAYWVLNGRLGLSTADEKYAIELWGRNLTDEEYIQVAFDVPFTGSAANGIPGATAAFLGDPRTYGVTLRARF